METVFLVHVLLNFHLFTVEPSFWVLSEMIVITIIIIIIIIILIIYNDDVDDDDNIDDNDNCNNRSNIYNDGDASQSPTPRSARGS